MEAPSNQNQLTPPSTDVVGGEEFSQPDQMADLLGDFGGTQKKPVSKTEEALEQLGQEAEDDSAVDPPEPETKPEKVEKPKEQPKEKPKEAPVKDEGDDEDEEIDDKELIKSLRAQLAKQATAASAPAKESTVAESAAKETKPAEKVDYGIKAPEDLVPDTWEKDVETKEGLAKILGNVYTRSVEDTLARLPQILTPLIQRAASQQVAVESFWNQNPDLMEYRDVAGHVANELYSKDPQKYNEPRALFEDAGKETRRRLGLRRVAQEIDSNVRDAEVRVRRPKGSAGSRKASGEDTRSDLQKEVSELL